MSEISPPSVLLVRDLFDYNKDTGELIWKKRPHPKAVRVFPGKVAGTPDTYGHLQVKVDGRLRGVHKVIWLHQTGIWPKSIDHINGIRNDNRWGNLRECTNSQNAFNSKMRSNNTSGYKGITYNGGTYIARIVINGKSTYLGRYKNPEDAHAAYMKAAKKLHGEFYNERDTNVFDK